MCVLSTRWQTQSIWYIYIYLIYICIFIYIYIDIYILPCIIQRHKNFHCIQVPWPLGRIQVGWNSLLILPAKRPIESLWVFFTRTPFRQCNINSNLFIISFWNFTQWAKDTKCVISLNFVFLLKKVRLSRDLKCELPPPPPPPPPPPTHTHTHTHTSPSSPRPTPTYDVIMIKITYIIVYSMCIQTSGLSFRYSDLSFNIK